MHNQVIAMCLLILVLILVIYYSAPYKPPATAVKGLSVGVANSKRTMEDIAIAERKTGLASFYNMTDGEKLQYIVDTYFSGDEIEYTDAKAANQRKADNAYIAKLPLGSNTCPDLLARCAEWAANGECQINPEFMLYSCPGSCGACALTEDERYNLVEIYNRREPPGCLPSAERPAHVYPDRNHYMRMLDAYHP